MEKKTIGKFISALRKANGMTQKGLGDKLFVSDKTVSRWECDECTPELSLIPLIAEIFDVTTDELLRGERNDQSREAPYTEETEVRQKAKSDRQFRLMLHNQQKKYKNLTLISVGVTILGLIAAAVANLAFSKGLIAFCLASAFISASEICQICFAQNARLMEGEEDVAYDDKIRKANTGVIKTAAAISFVNIAAFAFCLPLVTLIDGVNFGLAFDAWLGFGSAFAIAALVITYIVYTLFINKHLNIALTDKESARAARNRKLLTKTLAMAVSIAIVTVTAVVVIDNIESRGDEIKFDNYADFKAFVESDYEKWYDEEGRYINEYIYIKAEGNTIEVIADDTESLSGGDNESKTESDDNRPNMLHANYLDRNGDVIFEYYYNPDLYRSIDFVEYGNGEIQSVTVRRKGDQKNITLLLFALLFLNFVVAAGVYLIKAHKE